LKPFWSRSVAVTVAVDPVGAFVAPPWTSTPVFDTVTVRLVTLVESANARQSAPFFSSRPSMTYVPLLNWSVIHCMLFSGIGAGPLGGPVTAWVATTVPEIEPERTLMVVTPEQLPAK
jgi:hypothetical protein